MSLLKHTAIIDAGSGSIKLGIYKEENTHFELNYKRIAVREEKLVLIKKVKSGKLSDEDFEKVKRTFKEFIKIAAIYQIPANKIIVLTTKWFRILNLEEKERLKNFLTKGLKILSANIFELTGKKEAELSLKGVKSTSFIESANVVDMGGMTIEIASFTKGVKKINTKSSKLGVFYVKEYFKIKGRPNKEEREKITDFVYNSLKDDDTLIKGAEVITLDNFGNAIFSLYNWLSGIDDFPSHAKTITSKELEDTIKEISKVSYDRMVTTPYFDFDQWDLVEISMALLRGIMKATDSNLLTLSHTSIKEGYLAVKQED